MLDTASRIPLCRSCLTCFRPLTGPCCARCGRPFASPVALDREGTALCHVCRRGLYDFDFARSYTAYTETVAGAIILLKYQQVTPLAAWFASSLRKTFNDNREMCQADVIVPVPAHALRLRERGYNQAELIAKPLARSLGLPCRSYLLVRTRPRPDKLQLTLRERWRTVRGAYTIRHGLRVDNLRILLVDDVLTTGATLDACSRALRKAGAAKVVTLTVARAIPWREQAAIEPPRRESDG
jgi:ComF family protein